VLKREERAGKEGGRAGDKNGQAHTHIRTWQLCDKPKSGVSTLFPACAIAKIWPRLQTVESKIELVAAILKCVWLDDASFNYFELNLCDQISLWHKRVDASDFGDKTKIRHALMLMSIPCRRARRTGHVTRHPSHALRCQNIESKSA
jgi:hypothetical protein